jgi:hypothetical protein
MARHPVDLVVGEGLRLKEEAQCQGYPLSQIPGDGASRRYQRSIQSQRYRLGCSGQPFSRLPVLPLVTRASLNGSLDLKLKVGGRMT